MSAAALARHAKAIESRFFWGLGGGPGISIGIGEHHRLELEGRFVYGFGNIWNADRTNSAGTYVQSSEIRFGGLPQLSLLLLVHIRPMIPPPYASLVSRLYLAREETELRQIQTNKQRTPMNSLRKSILALGLILALGASVQAQSSKTGYVNATNVNMRSYHSTQSKVVGKLQKGETVLVLNQASTNSNTVEAILLKDAKFYSQDGEYRFTLPKGQGRRAPSL